MNNLCTNNSCGGASVAQDTQSKSGKILAYSAQNICKILVENTNNAPYDAGFLILQKMAACTVSPASGTCPALGHLEQIDSSWVNFSFEPICTFYL